jgi:hypothetical protein
VCLCFFFVLLIWIFGMPLLACRMKVYGPGNNRRTMLKQSGCPEIQCTSFYHACYSGVSTAVQSGDFLEWDVLCKHGTVHTAQFPDRLVYQ